MPSNQIQHKKHSPPPFRPNYHKVPTFGHLPSGMRRPSRIIGKLFPYPVGILEYHTSGAPPPSHQVQLRACQPATPPTNLNSKPSGCYTGNLEISELASKLRVDEPQLIVFSQHSLPHSSFHAQVLDKVSDLAANLMEEVDKCVGKCCRMR